MRKIQRYGWHPDLPDYRDQKLTIAKPQVLPTFVDLRPQMPAVYDQGDLGSCTANAIAGALEYDLMKEGVALFVPSRLFIYYNERVIEGTPDDDSGAELRDGCKSVGTTGACPETVWPYDIKKFDLKPPPSCYASASKDIASNYYRLAQVGLMLKSCLAQGYPFVFGFTVFESFESDQVAATGAVPMPADSEGVVGGHAVLCVGYIDATRRYIVRNSWGVGWGMSGYFTMPYEYVESAGLASDFWTLRRFAA